MRKPTEQVTEHIPSKSSFKIIALIIGGVIGVAHIGVLGHLINASNTIKYPIINLPDGKYSSYNVQVGKDGYKIEYRANDPKVLTSERSMNSDKDRRGLFGGGSEQRNEYRRDEYTAEGYRNMQGGGEIEITSVEKQSEELKNQWEKEEEPQTVIESTPSEVDGLDNIRITNQAFVPDPWDSDWNDVFINHKMWYKDESGIKTSN